MDEDPLARAWGEARLMMFACLGRLLAGESLNVLREAWSARFYSWDSQCYKGNSTLQGRLPCGAAVHVDPRPLAEPRDDTDRWVVQINVYETTPEDVIVAEVGGPLTRAGLRWRGPIRRVEEWKWLDDAGDAGRGDG